MLHYVLHANLPTLSELMEMTLGNCSFAAIGFLYNECYSNQHLLILYWASPALL